MKSPYENLPIKIIFIYQVFPKIIKYLLGTKCSASMNEQVRNQQNIRLQTNFAQSHTYLDNRSF